MKNIDEFALKRERGKGDYDRWIDFEHTLCYLLNELQDPTEREDDFLLNDIKQAIIVFATKSRFGEHHELFLDNNKRDFYNAIEKLEERHPDIASRTWKIKLFIEDFYFKQD